MEKSFRFYYIYHVCVSYIKGCTQMSSWEEGGGGELNKPFILSHLRVCLGYGSKSRLVRIVGW